MTRRRLLVILILGCFDIDNKSGFTLCGTGILPVPDAAFTVWMRNQMIGFFPEFSASIADREKIYNKSIF